MSGEIRPRKIRTKSVIIGKYWVAVDDAGYLLVRPSCHAPGGNWKECDDRLRIAHFAEGLATLEIKE